MSGALAADAAGTCASLARRVAGAAQHEAVVARIAVGLVALHVLDDSMLQPQPGTSAGDHLASGIVPCIVLLLAAAAYPRLRAGLRAIVVALAGLFGLASGTEALYFAQHDRLSGDDYTGLIAIAAGVVLFGVAVMTLWKARRAGGGVRRWTRRALAATATVAGLYMLVVPLLMSYVLTHVARAFVPPDRLGVAHEDVSFKTADGLRLRGWYVPSKNGAAVIAFPGRAGTQKPARLLARHGYGVLLFDRRGEGESDGDPNAWGWSSYRDVDAAVRFLQRRPDVTENRIGGVGLSVGGEMMLEAAARSHGLRAVVSEGAGERSINELLDFTGTAKWEQVPSYAALTAGIALFSDQLPPPSLKQLIPRIAPTPVFLIYGEHGQDGERNLNPTYYESARPPKQIWQVPGSGHVGGIDAHPAEYERRVVAFLDRALLVQPSDSERSRL
jgi:dienelactone hydrolase